MAEIVYLDSPLESEALFERLCPPVRQWFKDKFPDFTPLKNWRFQPSWTSNIFCCVLPRVQEKPSRHF